jgi:hypothetical protein
MAAYKEFWMKTKTHAVFTAEEVYELLTKKDWDTTPSIP